MSERATRSKPRALSAGVPEDARAVVRALPRAIQAVLGDTLAGVYLYGSLVAGDYDPQTSDIDILAVVFSEVGDRQLGCLAEMHDEFVLAHPAWLDRIDVAYVSATALQTFKQHESSIVVITPGEPITRKQTSPGWVMNWHLVREQGVALLGPPPRDLIASTTREDFLFAVRDHMRGMHTWANAARTPAVHAYAVVTACRALYTCNTREQASKRGAAHWAMHRYPEWSDLIEQALSWRSREASASPGEMQALPRALDFVRFAACEAAGERTSAIGGRGSA